MKKITFWGFFSLLLFFGTVPAKAQCVDCKEIYVWDFLTDDGDMNDDARRLTRLVRNVISQNADCKLIKPQAFSKDYEVDTTNLEMLAFADLPKDVQEKLKFGVKARSVLFGTLLKEGKKHTLSLSFEFLTDDYKGNTTISKDIYFSFDELEDPERSQAIIEKDFKPLLCMSSNEKVPQSKEEIREQLYLLSNQLEILNQVPAEKRSIDYYKSIDAAFKKFRLCYERFQEMQPSVTEVEQFERFKKGFDEKVQNASYDLLFSKLHDYENKYDELLASFKLKSEPLENLIRNREYCIEICEQLIKHNNTNDTDREKFETIKLNCYQDMVMLYSKDQKYDESMNFVQFKIKDLTPNLKDMVDKNTPVSRIANKPINLNIRFVKATANLLPESYDELGRLSEIMIKNPNCKVELLGHTDSRGDGDKLQEISELRATKVKEFLMNRKIDGSRITTAGFGGTRPVADNTREETRQLNRRVEVVFKEN